MINYRSHTQCLVREVHLKYISKLVNKRIAQKYGHLGVIYHPDHTIFRLFSPVASEVILSLGDDEYVMNYIEPIWEIDRGDQKNKPYV